MIRVGSIDKMTEYTCEKWMIVRSPDYIPVSVRHVPELSPSPELFAVYREAFHKGVFDQNFFSTVYVPRFLQELLQNEAAIGRLAYLCMNGKANDYYLGCYCSDETICHRSIIAGVLLGMGASIITDPDYLKYYQLLIQLKK